jgi:hypothetical protein
MGLGTTPDGVFDFNEPGQRIKFERWLCCTEAELEPMLDHMARHNIIERDKWEGLRKVTTKNAREQAAARARSKDISKNANAAKREKAKKANGDTLEECQ